MLFLLGLFIAAAVIEQFTVRSSTLKGLRSVLVGVAIAAVFLSGSYLFLSRWTVWGSIWLISLYRIVNLIRFGSSRLPEAELKRLAPRTSIWLILAELVIVAFSYLFVNVHWSRHYIGLFIALIQLLIAAYLLKSIFHTWKHTNIPPIINPRSDHDLPSLSVLIPARNETVDLEECLLSLVASDYPKLEIIVLDDCSVTKRTPEIIRMFAHDGVRFIQGEMPDEKNWLAKNQAYERLSSEASGGVLLFCGVDARFERQTLRLLVETMLERKKQMVSVLPLRADQAQSSITFIQPMRYLWELALPRKLFNRPPVLSTCWIISADSLKRLGGFKAVARKIVPEAYFANQLTAHDGYSFVRSNNLLGLASSKALDEQQATAIRTRYPQLHRRIELVVFTALTELFVFVMPLAQCFVAWLLPFPVYIFIASLTASLFLLTIYYFVAVRTKLNSPLLAWICFPLAIFTDVVLLHVSMIKYEFSSVEWKGRNVCIPVMRVEPHLPRIK